MLKLIYSSKNFNFVILGNTDSRRINVVRTKTTTTEDGFFYRILLSIENGLDIKADKVIEKLDKEFLVSGIRNVESVTQLFEEYEGIKQALETFEE